MNPQCPSRKSDGIVFGEACPRRASGRFLESRQGGFHAPYAAKEERTVMAKLLLGKPVIDSLREELKGRIAALEERGVKPGLAIVRVGAPTIWPMNALRSSALLDWAFARVPLRFRKTHPKKSLWMLSPG